MNRLIRIGNVAIHLRLRHPLRGETERPRFVVAGLSFALCEVDGSSVEAAGSTGLETGEVKAAAGETVAERFGAPSRRDRRPSWLRRVHDGFEESARRQHHGLGPIERLAARDHAGRPSPSKRSSGG